MSIVYQVWEDKRMPTDTKISLQTLSKEDDGIFLTSNFGDGMQGIYLTGEKVLLSARTVQASFRRGQVHGGGSRRPGIHLRI